MMDALAVAAKHAAMLVALDNFLLSWEYESRSGFDNATTDLRSSLATMSLGTSHLSDYYRLF